MPIRIFESGDEAESNWVEVNEDGTVSFYSEGIPTSVVQIQPETVIEKMTAEAAKEIYPELADTIDGVLAMLAN
jgi:hypothetical protein